MISDSIRIEIRQRAEFKCEFCGISEIDSGGELTIDHFHPKSKGGNDDLNNLIYCCIRCNQYKFDYWPNDPDEPMLFNPRIENFAEHYLELDDGTIYPLTSTGTFTLKRLRLNRPPLIANRLQKLKNLNKIQLLKKYKNLANLLEQLLFQQGELMEEQQELLRKQYELLNLLINK